MEPAQKQNIMNHTNSPDSLSSARSFAGVPTGGREPGLFVALDMNSGNPLLTGTMDYYRELAKTNPDVLVLVNHIDRIGAQLGMALEALALEMSKRLEAEKLRITG